MGKSRFAGPSGTTIRMSQLRPKHALMLGVSLTLILAAVGCSSHGSEALSPKDVAAARDMLAHLQPPPGFHKTAGCPDDPASFCVGARAQTSQARLLAVTRALGVDVANTNCTPLHLPGRPAGLSCDGTGQLNGYLVAL